MRPLSVDLFLLRSTAPDLALTVGRVLAARVVERQGQHGVISLAGAYLTAELPEEVKAGDTLRLVVQEARGDRAVLALAEERAAQVQTQTPLGLAEPPATATRDGVTVLGSDPDGAGASGERAHVVTLRFGGEGLGTVELRVALTEELVHARAALADGPPLELARAHAGALREALSRAAARTAEVEISARPDRLDVYV